MMHSSLTPKKTSCACVSPCLTNHLTKLLSFKESGRSGRGIQFPGSGGFECGCRCGIGGSLRHDYSSLINSPGHVVYIFCCKVEGLYLRMASLESTERQSGVYLITCEHRSRDMWHTLTYECKRTAEINRHRSHIQ